MPSRPAGSDRLGPPRLPPALGTSPSRPSGPDLPDRSDSPSRLRSAAPGRVHRHPLLPCKCRQNFTPQVKLPSDGKPTLNRISAKTFGRADQYLIPGIKAKAAKVVVVGHRGATEIRRRRSATTTRRAIWWLSATPESGSASREGDERQMIGGVHTSRCVLPDDGGSGTVAWKASEDRHASGRDRGRAGPRLRKLRCLGPGTWGGEGIRCRADSRCLRHQVRGNRAMQVPSTPRRLAFGQILK